MAPESTTEVLGDRRGMLHLRLLPAIADLDLIGLRRRFRVEATAIEPPGHFCEEVAWLAFQTTCDPDDRAEPRNAKAALKQADLSPMQAGSLGRGSLREV
jgi:hypothetical protein